MPQSTQTTPEKQITLLGIGRAGTDIADRVKRQFAFPGLVVIAADTDRETLDAAGTDHAVLLGGDWAGGEGCGGDMQMAERAVTASAPALREVVTRSRMVLAASGLGGGVGSATPAMLARLGRECAVPVLFLVTMPFSFEGAKRVNTAENALDMLRDETDAVIAVPNSLLFGQLPPDTPSREAFGMASNLLAKSLAGLARICCANGLLTADLAGVKRIVRRPGSTCALAIGHGKGPEAAEEAIRDFMLCPFVGGEHRLRDVDAALITVLGGDNLAFGTVQQCLERVQSHFPAEATVLVGAYTDSRMADSIQMTGLLVQAAGKESTNETADLFQTDQDPGKSRQKRRKKRRQEPDPDQDMLPFPEQQLGVFAGSPQPTYRHGENLDVPTFQRRNKRIDPGIEL